MPDLPFSSWSDYFDQGEIWISAEGPIRIADMDPRHRANAARWALRKAKYFEIASGFELLRIAPPPDSAAADDFDEWLERRMDDPERWLRETTLYRSLVGQEAEDHDD